MFIVSLFYGKLITYMTDSLTQNSDLLIVLFSFSPSHSSFITFFFSLLSSLSFLSLILAITTSSSLWVRDYNFKPLL